MKKIAILTSGGDSQGMNTAVRAVAKTAITKGIDVYGIKRGYKGLYEDQIFQMTSLNVSGIADQGGTILLSARLPEFKDPEVRAKAAENLKKRGIDPSKGNRIDYWKDEWDKYWEDYCDEFNKYVALLGKVQTEKIHYFRNNLT